MDKKLFIFALLVLVIITSVIFIKYKPTKAIQTTTTLLPSDALNTKTISIGKTTLQVEFATTSAEWSWGLSNRTSLEKDNGMIFIFSTSQIQSFWMKDTLIPLDIIWIQNHMVVGLDQMFPELDVPIQSLKHFNSPSAVDVVIETNLNWTKNNNIKVGDEIKY